MKRLKYKPKFEPFAHQKEALQRLKGQSAFALLMAMRTGKTKVVLDDFGQLELDGLVQDHLLVAPAGVYKTWGDEEGQAIHDHVSVDLQKRMKVHVWRPDAVSQRAQRLQQQFIDQRERPRFLAVDIEALSTVDRVRQMVMEFLDARISYTTIDESTTIKNPDSKRTSFVIDKLRLVSNYRRILSGLPAPNSPFDVWSQFYFLDPDILGPSYANHKAFYAEIDNVCMLPNEFLYNRLIKKAGNRIEVANGQKMYVRDLGRKQLLQELDRRKIWVRQVPLVRNYRNEEELHDIIAPHSYRVRLEDCYDMPQKVYMRRDVELTPEQKRIYKDLKNNAFAELDSKDFVTTKMVLDRMLRMHQVVCGHVKDELGKEHYLAENRTAEVLAVLEEYDGKAVIWCSYDPDVRKVSEALMKVYGEGSVARFWGGNTKTREQEEKIFKNDKNCRFMIATPSAGGRGRTWSVANMLLYYSSTNNLEHRAQSEERGEGVGKTQPVACIDLIAPNTVDEKIIKSLRNKINMSSKINGDNYKEWLI